MNKRTSQHFGKTFATFWAKLAACALSLPFYTVGTIGGNVVLTETAYAQNCTGTTFACATYINGWNTVKGSASVTNITSAEFTFSNTTNYPITSDPITRVASAAIYVTVPFGGNLSQAQNSANFILKPSSSVTAVGSDRYRINGVTSDLTFSFEGSFDGQNWTKLGGAQTAVPYNNVIRGSTNAVLQIRVRAHLASPQAQNININTTTIFEMYNPNGRDPMGSVVISGAPAISVVVPKPKTCNSVNGTTRSLDLGKIAVTDLNNNTRQNPKSDTFNLLNCPAGVRLKLTLEDVNKTTSTDNYLTNSLTGSDAAVNAGIQLIFDGDTNPKRMKTSWNRTGLNTANATNPINYSARFFHIGGNLKPGKINAAAKLTIEYP